MQKRGQLFIVAALIVVAALYALTATVNSVQASRPNQAFYDLSNEIDFESKRVIDYGIYTAASNPTELVGSFLTNYTGIIGEDQAIFIYGNVGSLHGLHFTGSYLNGGIGISTGSVPDVINIQSTTQRTAEVTQTGNSVLVKIDDLIYSFELREGENFFFIIIKGGSGEAFVATQD